MEADRRLLLLSTDWYLPFAASASAQKSCEAATLAAICKMAKESAKALVGNASTYYSIDFTPTRLKAISDDFDAKASKTLKKPALDCLRQHVEFMAPVSTAVADESRILMLLAECVALPHDSRSPNLTSIASSIREGFERSQSRLSSYDTRINLLFNGLPMALFDAVESNVIPRIFIARAKDLLGESEFASYIALNREDLIEASLAKLGVFADFAAIT